MLGMAVYTFNPSRQKVEAGSLWVQGQPGLQSVNPAFKRKCQCLFKMKIVEIFCSVMYRIDLSRGPLHMLSSFRHLSAAMLLSLKFLKVPIVG